MADIKFTGLPAATSLDLVDLLAVTQDVGSTPINRKAPLSDMKELILLDPLAIGNLLFSGNTISSITDDIILSPDGTSGLKNKNMGDISGLIYKLGVVPLTLDQQNTTWSGTYLTDDMWQSWKPSATALLGKVEIEINSAPSATLTIRIYAGEGTGGALLATKTITSIIPNDWNAFVFDTPFLTVGAATHTMRATSTVGGFQWRISTADPYPDGRFSEDPGWDAAFKTYNAEPIRAISQDLETGYIGLMNETNPETLVEITDSTDVLWTLHNSTPSDSDNARSSGFIFKGHQSGDEETTLAKILISHHGTGDDEKGKIVFYTNDGTDGDSPTEIFTLDSDRLCAMAGDLEISGNLYVYAGEFSVLGARPFMIMQNTTTEDFDGGRESTFNFYGAQSGGEISNLGIITFEHDGSGDDQKGRLLLKVNDGSDGFNPTERFRIDSAGLGTFTGRLKSTGDILSSKGIVGVGDIEGFVVTYNDNDTINISAGYCSAHGKYYELTADTTHDLTSLASARDFHYIYIDDSESTSPTAVIIDSTIEPSWSDARLGWYNGDNDRLIGAVISTLGAATIDYFSIDVVSSKNLRFVCGTRDRLATTMNPTGAWQTPNNLNGSDVTPTNAISLQLIMNNQDLDSTVVLACTNKEQGDVNSATNLGNCVDVLSSWASITTQFIALGTSRDIYIAGANDDDNFLSVWMFGFGYSR